LRQSEFASELDIADRVVSRSPKGRRFASPTLLLLLEEDTPMPKALSISGMVVAVLLLLLFGLDLALKFPFSGAEPVMDIGFVVCSVLLAYMSWSTYRELP
jgi:hypothetical protein